MRYPRETVYAAVFAALQAITWTSPVDSSTQAWKTTGRYLQAWDNVPAVMQPAMFMRCFEEDSSQEEVGLSLWTLKAEVWIYLQATPFSAESAFYPALISNPVKDALDATITLPGATENFGLTGIVKVVLGRILEVDPVAPDTQIILRSNVSILTGV